ncbi:response regulator [Aquipseudomonas ullengensis]|uniref:Response regulator n=1 Tax=Aquipseudomonas ullengensis TaxID=2759166 RepID=A0A7W4LJL2_9GAMM|nr:response regulator [Pseudomonas ullengensis]MBB2494374.1 response regulator [Pseudomonas ullengensis]
MSSPLPGTVNKIVVLVEDDTIVRLLTVEVLEELGYHVLAFGDAVPALELLRGAQVAALLMTDVGLPGMDGRALAHAARALRPSLPVLFASGYSERELLDEMRSQNQQARTESVTKPYNLDLLRERVRSLIGE